MTGGVFSEQKTERFLGDFSGDKVRSCSGGGDGDDQWLLIDKCIKVRKIVLVEMK